MLLETSLSLSHKFSDHRAISLTLRISDIVRVCNNDDLVDLSDAPGKFVFDENGKIKYIDTLLSPEYQDICQE